MLDSLLFLFQIESQSMKDASSPEPSSGFKLPSSMRRILFTLFSRTYLQALTMTFLAEWGDRSQIATVILAAREVGYTLTNFIIIFIKNY